MRNSRKGMRVLLFWATKMKCAKREIMFQPMHSLKLTVTRQMSNTLVNITLKSTVRAPLNTHLIPALAFYTPHCAIAIIATTRRYFSLAEKVDKNQTRRHYCTASFWSGYGQLSGA